MKIPAKLKNFLNDSMWSIAGLMLMNVVAQFVVYPVWSRSLGDEMYGNVLYFLSLMNIVAISMGSGCNYARMARSAAGPTQNDNYNFCMGIATVLVIPFVAVIRHFEQGMSGIEWMLFALLVIFTMWRFYADVEFRLSLDYRGYFLYYAIISVGYGVGIVLFWLTGLWPLALLVGEISGLCWVFARGKVLRSGWHGPGKGFSNEGKLILVMFGTNVLSNVIFNGDRLVLMTFLGGTAVTTYYLASLLGKTLSLVTTPLNSVIIGHLAQYKGRLTVRMMHLITVGCVGVTFVGTAGAWVGAYVLIAILYPQNLAEVQAYFAVANMSQILYFVGNVITVVLLRFSKPRCQVYVNTVYAVAFVVLCIPGTFLGGFNGFCVTYLGVCVLRLCTALGLGYMAALRANRQEESEAT